MARIQILQGARYLMFWHGLWSKNDIAKLNKFDKIRLILGLILFWGLGMGTTSHLIHGIFFEKSIMPVHRIIEDMSVSLSSATMFFFLCVFVWKHDKAADILKDLENYQFGKYINVEEKNVQINLMSKIFYVYVIIGQAACAIFERLTIPNCKEENLIFDRSDVCGLFRRVYLPFSIDYSPAYEIFYVFQLICALNMYLPTASVVLFIFGTIQHLIFHLENLKAMIADMGLIQNEKDRKNYFVKCVEYHTYIISLLDKINECYNIIMFVFKFFGSLLFSIIAYEFLLERSLAVLIYLGGWLITTFLMSFGGQKLMDQGESVGLAFYNCNWYEFGISFKKDIMFAIMRTQRQLPLKTSIFGTMSISTFVTVIRASYSFLTLLTQKT